MNCPVCESEFQPLYRIHRYNPPLEIIVCPNCGLQRQKTFPQDLSSLYQEGYYTGCADYSYIDERSIEQASDFVWQARLKTISKFVQPPARFLDVGCSFGGFVDAATRLGYQSTGIDLSEFAVTQGKKLGRNIVLGDLSIIANSNEKFDIITLIEVIEHLPEPLQTVRQLRSLLRNHGIVVIQTANFLGCQAKKAKSDYHYYLPGHLYYYSTKNLRKLLLSNGFRKVWFYRPVDFGLWPKLQKMITQMRSQPNHHNQKIDYKRLFQSSMYHLQGKLALNDFSYTSSMVCYALVD